jgi:glycosyltransferase involved in cell wall biosynthesis
MGNGISVILPAFREAENLKVLIPALFASKCVRECVVVEDPSGDATRSVMEELLGQFGTKIIYKRNPERLGLAKSIAIGLSASTYSHCLVRDSDLNHDTEILPEFQARLATSDFVIASRYLGFPKIQRTNDLFSVLVNYALRIRFGSISDWTYGYFLVNRSLLQTLPIEEIFQGRGEYSVRLYSALLAQNPRFSEIATVVLDRGHGKSTTRTFRDGVPYLKAVFSIPDLFSKPN